MKCMLAQAVCSFLGHALAPSPPYSIVLAPCPQYSPTLAPNNTILHLKSSKHGNQTGSRIATPALAPCPPYSPGLAPYTGSHNSVLNLKNSRLEVDLQPQALHWLPTRAPCIQFYLKDIHKGIFKNETPIHIPNFICFQEIIIT